MIRRLFCVACDAKTEHQPHTHPGWFACACGTVRTAAGAILYGIEATP